jgi:hypothetical protein
VPNKYLSCFFDEKYDKLAIENEDKTKNIKIKLIKEN